MPRFKDLTGQQFGRLTIIQKASGYNRTHWECVCDCGTYKTIRGGDISSGKTQSCGCLLKERITKHGQSDTKLYAVWHSMLQRCYNPKSSVYAYYGAIGVTVCQTWRTSYEDFVKWAMESRYVQGLSIDRIDGSLQYSPETCRWATKTLQVRNRRPLLGKSSQFIGVYYRSRYSNFIAQIQINGKVKYLGIYPTEVQAALARDRYITENSLEGYTLNFT